MNLPLLLKALSSVGDDPDRVNQIRKIVVALAITGKLDAHTISLRPAQIAESIDRVKAALVKRGSLQKQKKDVPVTQMDLPEAFSDPSIFARLGEIAQIEKGKTGIQQAKPGSFPLVVTAAERDSCDHFDFDGAAALVPLVSSTGHGKASLNRLHYQEGKFALGTILVGLFPYEPTLISARFLFEYLSAFKDELLVSRMTGTANVTLTIGQIARVPIPLICPEVQKRVDELMALCDRLEAARKDREAKRDRLSAASLARLNTPDPETFTADARFTLEALPALTTRPNQIKQLRQTILNLAVRGKLVPQGSNDEPASELLKRIAKEKARLVKESKRTESRVILRRSNEETSGLPASWLRIAFGEACNVVTSGSRGWAEFYSTSGAGFIRAQNIRFGKLLLNDLAFVNPPTNSEGSRTQVKRGDLLIVITGAGVTNPALLECDLEEAYVSQHVGLARPTDPQLSPWFLLCLMADAGGRAELVERAYGAGKPGLNLENIRLLQVPLPPLAEQHRIVAKVDELMALCDRLEASLTTSDQTRTRLLEATLAEALAPASISEMEAAE